MAAEAVGFLPVIFADLHMNIRASCDHGLSC